MYIKVKKMLSKEEKKNNIQNKLLCARKELANTLYEEIDNLDRIEQLKNILNLIETNKKYNYEYLKSVIENKEEFKKYYYKLCYTISDIQGILGDFFLTNMNQESRNFAFGMARFKSSNEASNYLKCHTVEGYENLENIVNFLGKSLNFYPILYTIYDIIYKNKKADMLVEICFKRN